MPRELADVFEERLRNSIAKGPKEVLHNLRV